MPGRRPGRTDGFDERLHAHVAAIEADTGLQQLSRNTLRKATLFCF